MSLISDRYSTGSTSFWRAVLGFALAPLFSSLVVVGIVVAAWIAGIVQREGWPNLLELAAGYAGMVVLGVVTTGAPISYAGMMLVGFPA